MKELSRGCFAALLLWLLLAGGEGCDLPRRLAAPCAAGVASSLEEDGVKVGGAKAAAGVKMMPSPLEEDGGVKVGGAKAAAGVKMMPVKEGNTVRPSPFSLLPCVLRNVRAAMGTPRSRWASVAQVACPPDAGRLARLPAALACARSPDTAAARLRRRARVRLLAGSEASRPLRSCIHGEHEVTPSGQALRCTVGVSRPRSTSQDPKYI